jgi:two-component system, response regulator RegA
MTVLLVDDDEDALTLLRMLLERRGFEVVCAGSLAEARARLLDTELSAVVADVQLGDGSGLLLYEAARALPPPRCLLRFVVLTGLRSVQVANDVCVLRKPFDVDALAAALRADSA